ncbi:putative disease resistance RPP13-like protein 1 [Oryza glaberrima]|uniref:putative disease resistance RPP13-like protein 1 n=1 Tax=Oryza glaberrima TaxID=4538 RepID=UPI00224BE8D0|nr:putative disease resistance RPP13-like protein 1 [Oryza glaberrima]
MHAPIIAAIHNMSLGVRSSLLMAAAREAFAAKLANVLVGMAKEEVETLLGVPGAIAKLETTLADLSSILADADRRRIDDPGVERWVRELKDAMYDADDILDLFRAMEGGEDPGSPPRAAPAPSACWSALCRRSPAATRKIGRKIQELNRRVEEIAKRSSRFGFVSQVIHSSSALRLTDRPMCSCSSESSRNRKTGPSIIRSDVVGDKIDLHTRNLVDLLIGNKLADGRTRARSSGDVIAVAITGAGGIGKTTLARMVFNDAVLESHFEKKVWLSVNQEVNEVHLLHGVIAAFGGSYHGCAGDKALLEDTLKHAVRQKRFLLVMDDVWSDRVWSDLLRAPLGACAPGSRVLVTTRNDGVARGMRAQHLHRVEKLDLGDSWSLLKKQVVLNEGDESEIDGLEDIGLKIVERCDGLPLAIKVVGGLLLNKGKTRDAWVNVSNHFAWSMTRSNDDINKAVYLSYEELPPHLKQCFVFCSLFPKDELIIRGVIVRMWIAQGYGHDIMRSTLPEDLGVEYYNELVSRNLLEPYKRSYDLSASTMHDVIRSFAQQIVKDEGLLVNDRQDVHGIAGASKLRHLSVSKTAIERVAIQKQVSLRTLLLFGRCITEFTYFRNNISCLRVLHLQGVDLVDLPDYICHLKHLRYLGLANTGISAIPRGIGNLKFLQFIDLMGCRNFHQLPDSILKLQNMRFLDFRGTRLTSIPPGMGKLENLVNMLGFPTYLDDRGHAWSSLEELRSLSNLKWLDLRGLELASSGSMAATAMLNSKKHLKILDLTFASRLTDNGMIEGTSNVIEEQERAEDVLSNLCPPPCVECLTVNGYFGY